MQDPVTDLPPPARLFPEDLNNFAAPHPSPSLAEPFFSWTQTYPPYSPDLLLIAINKPACHLVHYLPSKTLIGTLLLPELSAKRSSTPSVTDKACYIYKLNLTNDPNPDQKLIILVNIQYSVAPERATAFAKVLLREMRPANVVISGAISRHQFRGKLSADDTFIFKFETVEQRRENNEALDDVHYFPSGSIIDGLAAALISRCQILKLKASLVVSWPEAESSVVKLLCSVFEKLCPGAEWDVSVETPFYTGFRTELLLYA